MHPSPTVAAAFCGSSRSTTLRSSAAIRKLSMWFSLVIWLHSSSERLAAVARACSFRSARLLGSSFSKCSTGTFPESPGEDLSPEKVAPLLIIGENTVFPLVKVT
ncbi:hypothetical protein EYF80_004087 [Liparis tanakae]|uniref:Uncharacterized protein n=1 Tax=Liparis tanakae TaxID=230148 RepID=A0A4Z2J504_9TELE|nr:hypothetical protein EYF80_004087 [Liparis tanakae]